MIWVVLCIFSLVICLIEFIVLLKDQGIFAELVKAACDLAHKQGIAQVIFSTVSLLWGVIVDCCGKVFHPIRHDNILHIAFAPSGGLGDYIVSAKILEELLEICDCRIDVFCENQMFGQAVYGNRRHVQIKRYTLYEKKRNSYDLGLSVEHFIHVKNINKKRLGMLSRELLMKMIYIQDNWKDLYVSERQQWCRERIQFERCKVLGQNRWTELRMGKAFLVDTMGVEIPLSESFQEIWHRDPRSKERYITVNYGTDIMKKGHKQIKMWPREHYEKLTEMIHKGMKGIKIYQLGDKMAEKIEGCDAYLLGESLELVKWILRDSKCHVDCEGGLVHLATQLGTKCIVMFGPTPEHMYAYPQNINLRGSCDYCMGLHREWAYECFKAEGKGECMRSIRPENVLENVKKIMAEY